VALIELNRNPERSELRWFAGLWFPAFCLLAGLSLWRKFHHPEAAIVLWTMAAALGIAGVLAPRIIRPVYTTLIWITFPLGWVLSEALLFAMFFLVITPFGFVVRLFHDPMSRSFDRSATSYWLPREARNRESYTRQV